jgi:hypothetical protein
MQKPKLPSETVARLYTGHHQIANAIADDEGGDAFVREKKALHCGIRKHCVPFYASEEADEPSGVEMVKSIDYDGADTNGLRYQKPDITGLDMADHLSEQELLVFWGSSDETTAT